MPKEDLAPYQRNLALKKAFAEQQLDLAVVMEFTPLDLDLENSRLAALLEFVAKYRELGSREALEAVSEDYMFPPIFPGIAPESDWFRFERWVRGESVRVKLAEQLTTVQHFRPPEEIDEEEIAFECQRLVAAFRRAEYGICLNEGIPARLVYAFLYEMLEETLELLGKGGGWFIDGCTGYCPGCFQRPWCSTGESSCWSEDEAAGRMDLIDEVQAYVSASPLSLHTLRELQAEDDASLERFRAEHPELYAPISELEDDWRAQQN